MRKSRPNAYEIKILTFIIVLNFAVVFMRWWWPPSRVNGLRRCDPTNLAMLDELVKIFCSCQSPSVVGLLVSTTRD